MSVKSSTLIVGPLPETPGGMKYLASFIDQFSRSAKIALLSKKSVLSEAFENFKKTFENENECKIKVLHSHQGGEYVGLKKVLDKYGIRLEFSAAYCPEQNGLAERFNRTLFDQARTMIATSGTKENRWGETAAYSNEIREVIGTNTSDGCNASPFQRRTGKFPPLSVKRFRVFGCLAIVYKDKAQRSSKLGPRSWEGIFIGIAPNGLWKVLDMSSDRIHLARNVRFDETKFPLNERQQQSDEPESNPISESESECGYDSNSSKDSFSGLPDLACSDDDSDPVASSSGEDADWNSNSDLEDDSDSDVETQPENDQPRRSAQTMVGNDSHP